MHLVHGVSTSEASMAFGKVVHRVAVRRGSKTELGLQIGQPKKVISTITQGMAFTLEREVLEQLLRVIAEEVSPSTISHMKGLLNVIKPS